MESQSVFQAKNLLFIESSPRGRRGRGCRREWRRLTEKLCDLLLDCVELELDSGVELRESKAVSQMFQMLEAARSDEGQRHLRFFLRLINNFAKRSCSHKSNSAAMCFLAVEQMVSSVAAAYPRVSKSSLKKTFLPECYRGETYMMVQGLVNQ